MAKAFSFLPEATPLEFTISVDFSNSKDPSTPKELFYTLVLIKNLVINVAPIAVGQFYAVVLLSSSKH